ncbi:MAG: hypothetical protein KAR40_06345 [Candidatus Sabulitectum sp.]|nr:hypothetical protein [Candidatus Sabulitectum sp.]
MGNEPTEIAAIGYMPSVNSEKGGSYYEFSMLLGHTDLTEPTKVFDENWNSLPVEVFSDPELEIIGVAGGEWLMFELDEPFFCDGSSNLLFEMSWVGPVDPVFRRIYTMTWEDDASRALVAMSPDSASGYLTTIIPNLLFVTAQALEAQTFAGIKNSF